MKHPIRDTLFIIFAILNILGTFTHPAPSLGFFLGELTGGVLAWYLIIFGIDWLYHKSRKEDTSKTDKNNIIVNEDKVKKIIKNLEKSETALKDKIDYVEDLLKNEVINKADAKKIADYLEDEVAKQQITKTKKPVKDSR